MRLVEENTPLCNQNNKHYRLPYERVYFYFSYWLSHTEIKYIAILSSELQIKKILFDKSERQCLTFRLKMKSDLSHF